MARIRIVDEWLRSPVSGPSRHRTVMVVAESWSEQRVLMRAFMGAHDQTRPTIVLHGAELAIGPASAEAHGSWGIHVEPPIDGRAQELRSALELAARRLAGSKGNPPRLADEPSRFEERSTGQWAPGAPSATPVGARTHLGRYYEPADSMPASASTAMPAMATVAAMPAMAPAQVLVANPQQAVVSERPRSRTLGVARITQTPFGESAAASEPAPPPASYGAAPAAVPTFDGSRTQPNFAPPPPLRPFAAYPRPSQGFGVPVPAPSRTTATGTSTGDSLARLVGHTMPLGFRLDDTERVVLDWLGAKHHMTASEIAALAQVADGVAWMQALINKLGEFGLDLVAAGPPSGNEPTYLLRR